MLDDKCSMKLRWQFGIIAGIFLAVFASYPQLKMWYLQGDDWQGHYAYNDIDEVAYAAYLKALIDGRPRKNDPYTGRDDTARDPQPESLFSVQFAAPYTIAIPARIFGVPATWAMILAGALAGFLTAFACFWLIGMLTKNSLFAMMGSLVVLCGGALAAGEGAIGEILGIGGSYPYFPFLRRYIPAVPFPVFFALIGSVWLFVKNENLSRRILWCVVSALCFSYLVFSYFYLWTSAAAWLFCIASLWLIIRPNGWAKDFQGFAALGGACLIPLAVYAFMLSNRVEAMDSEVLLLVYTRAIDLWRFPQLIGLISNAILAVSIWRGIIRLKSPETVFAFSFAVVPFVLFNQQIITGRTLQPIHYEVFIGNYIAALGLVVSLGLIFRKVLKENSVRLKAVLIFVSIAAIVWGFVECHYTVRVLDEANLIRDRGMPLARRLVELSKSSPDPHKSTVFSLSNLHADDSPTIAPQNVLWARHQHVFVGLTWQGNKERYYQYLYYQNLDEKWLEKRLRQGDFVTMITLFGWGRHTNRLSPAAKPLTSEEITLEARRFGEYRRNFDFEKASNPRLSFLVLPSDWNMNFENLDRWYERSGEEEIGMYKLYKLKLRDKNSSR